MPIDTPPPSAKVVLLHSAVREPSVAANLMAMDEQIVKALETAIALNVPQGYIVAVLHGHAQAQTQRMLDGT